MSHFDDFCNALAQETLMEMAENFFGERASIDEEKERFAIQAHNLRQQAQLALAKSALVHALLVTEENAHELYYRLGIRAGELMLHVEPEQARLDCPMPFAFTARHRHAKLLLLAYAAQQQACDAYMNGSYQTLPGHPNQPGRKRLTMHYKLLKDWAGHINRRIRKVNEGLAPSCVLGFARSMNVDSMEKERITGATLNNYCCSLDQDLAIAPVSCHDQGLMELPDLPPMKEVRHILRSLAGEVFSAHGEQLSALLHRLASGRERDLTAVRPPR